mmetsp:Transcript_3500/g.10863  ORF Transcript_3500/g.10863 Transcript_3500/m.10863 type:complete len:246 (-) Transcript_3500:805-1542(-)
MKSPPKWEKLRVMVSLLRMRLTKSSYASFIFASSSPSMRNTSSSTSGVLASAATWATMASTSALLRQCSLSARYMLSATRSVVMPSPTECSKLSPARPSRETMREWRSNQRFVPVPWSSRRACSSTESHATGSSTRRMMACWIALRFGSAPSSTRCSRHSAHSSRCIVVKRPTGGPGGAAGSFTLRRIVARSSTTRRIGRTCPSVPMMSSLKKRLRASTTMCRGDAFSYSVVLDIVSCFRRRELV